MFSLLCILRVIDSLVTGRRRVLRAAYVLISFSAISFPCKFQFLQIQRPRESK